MTIRRPVVLCTVAVAAGLLAGCSNPRAATETTAPPAATAAAQQPPAARTVTGPVLETMDASSYTYVRVQTPAGDVWAAASQFKVAVGDTVTFPLDQPMQNFHSKALDRDFPLIYFVSAIAREGDPAPGTPAPAAAMAVGHAQGPHGAAGAPPPAAVTTPIDPPKGGTTVADVWKTRKTLAGTTVTVRGKVMKYNGGIMGVNWIHLQDGTGTGADGSNDITVTSDAEARPGEIITVTGTVALDKDLGSGYFYPVIIEHAKIVDRGVEAIR